MWFILWDISEIKNMLHVTIRLQKHEWKVGRTRNDVETWASSQVFLQLFRVLTNFNECFFSTEILFGQFSKYFLNIGFKWKMNKKMMLCYSMFTLKSVT